MRKVQHRLLQMLSAMQELLCYCWSYEAYPNSFCYVFPPWPDQFLLAIVQAEVRRKQLCLGHLGQVQGVFLPKSRWLGSLYGYLLRKDQEKLPVLARGNLWLGSLFKVPASDLPKFWPCYNSKQENYDPIFLERPETGNWTFRKRPLRKLSM